MQWLLLVQNNTGRGFRVVRRGYHFVVQTKKRNGEWDSIYKVQVLDKDGDEAAALLGAIRKCLYFCEDMAQLGMCLSMLQRDEKIGGIAHPLSVIASLPRSAFLTARIPKELKQNLILQKDNLREKLRIPVTLADYLIYRLSNDGEDEP